MIVVASAYQNDEEDLPGTGLAEEARVALEAEIEMILRVAQRREPAELAGRAERRRAP